MDKKWYLQFTTVIAAAVIGVLTIWPSLEKWAPAPDIVKEMVSGRVNPGLDIRGGLRLMYEVEVDEYIRDQRDKSSKQMRRELGVKLGVLSEDDVDSVDDSKLTAVDEKLKVELVGDRQFKLKFADAASRGKFTYEWMKERFTDLRIAEREGNDVLIEMRADRLDALTTEAVQQAVLTIGNRVDELGLGQANVEGRAGDIIVEIPGEDPEMFDRIRGIISRTARLEFRVVDDESDFVRNIAEDKLTGGVTRQAEQAPAGESNPAVTSFYLLSRGPKEVPEGQASAAENLKTFIAGLELPANRELVVSELPGTAEEQVWRTYYVHADTNVTGEDIDNAQVAFDPENANQPYVGIRFNGDGARKFEELTGRNVQRRMAIVLDGRAASAPVIQQRIGGGNASITLGSGSIKKLVREAKDLVVVLKAGALPAPLRPANEQLIGSSLGEDSVKAGAMGAVIGIGVVLLFMLLYYQVAGIIADLMVILNIVLLIAIMAALKAPLTLPGIASIALTVGMAVDANVLITERIREELRLGKSPRSAVEHGFQKAFWSVVDSQITTFIAGVVLFQYGTGPIKGFATMLMIGIVTSLFTGLFCSRVLFEGLVRGLKVERLRVG